MGKFEEEIDGHIAEGERLRDSIIAFIDTWPCDETGVARCPADAYRVRRGLLAETHRWFNSADQKLRTALNYGHFRNILGTYLTGITNALGSSDGVAVLRERVNANFEKASSVLFSAPEPMEASAPPAPAPPTLPVQPNTAFILMWMDKNHPELEDVAATFREVFQKFGITATRADDIEHEGLITDVILGRIRTSEVLIADLTGERPNVYYEVGYAHAMGKRPILFRREGTSVHFDLSGYMVPQYKNLAELRTLLTKRLQAITGKEV